MLKKVLLGLLPMAVAALLSAPVHAAQPIQLSLLAPIQVVPESDSISGLRISLLYGKNAGMTGLDWGLVSHTTGGNSLGIALGGVNFNEGAYQGLQWGCFNYCESMNGLQLGFINYAKKLNGVQIGLLNFIQAGGFMPVFPIFNYSF